MNETVIRFDCHGDQLIGILHSSPTVYKNLGVVIVVGGPQYRVGSHRQFTIMARDFAAAGYPTLRFDYRGMGDSEGEFKGFECIDDDIDAAISALLREESGLDGIVLWGLCDAASACLIYGNKKDERVKGMILANPWVRTVSGEAKAYLKHYYLKRIFQKSFWDKVFFGSSDLSVMVSDLKTTVQSVFLKNNGSKITRSFLDKMIKGIEAFNSPILLLISGNDLTAQEFIGLKQSEKKWSNILDEGQIEWFFMDDADHTFSSHGDLCCVMSRCTEWLSDKY